MAFQGGRVFRSLFRTNKQAGLHHLQTATRCQPLNTRFLSGYLSRTDEHEGNCDVSHELKQKHFEKSWAGFRDHFDFPQQTLSPDEFKEGSEVTIRGYAGKRKNMSSKLAFLPLLVDNGPSINLVSQWHAESTPEHSTHQSVKAIPPYSPISVTGKVVNLTAQQPGRFITDKRFPLNVGKIELDISDIRLLNPFPKDIIVSKGVQFPPQSRHLQLRFDHGLRQRLYFRDYLVRKSRDALAGLGLYEIETPILFKSTPEGAREFLVPTRRKGLAYALPQSPQQYKQILMASGFSGYYQFARCFRDEDLRADRQPEFTQLDMEMAFATGKDVVRTIEALVTGLYSQVGADFVLRKSPKGFVPVRRPPELEKADIEYPPLEDGGFEQISYEDAMTLYGSDKPDLRIPNQICRIDQATPDSFVKMITDIENPIIEACKLRLNGDAATIRKYVAKFVDNLPRQILANPDGLPTIITYNRAMPMNGLSALGHECYETITSGSPEFSSISGLQEGDVLLIQARHNEPFSGGSTMLGQTRSLLYNAAVNDGLIPLDPSFRFLWVTDFPLFTANNNVDPGQGGTSGFSSTHHPFTAPKTARDFELLLTDPMRARADHYDLVVNGVELGGGSRRIHVAQVQEFVMRDVLRVSDQTMKQFAHLIEVLRAGCPPHAGLALGWDRVVATLSGTESIRDVIAFPKSMKGEDLFAQSPSMMTPEQLETYHLTLSKNKEKP